MPVVVGYRNKIDTDVLFQQKYLIFDFILNQSNFHLIHTDRLTRRRTNLENQIDKNLFFIIIYMIIYSHLLRSTNLALDV